MVSQSPQLNAWHICDIHIEKHFLWNLRRNDLKSSFLFKKKIYSFSFQRQKHFQPRLYFQSRFFSCFHTGRPPDAR